jgi:hypothetical protein
MGRIPVTNGREPAVSAGVPALGGGHFLLESLARKPDTTACIKLSIFRSVRIWATAPPI